MVERDTQNFAGNFDRTHCGEGRGTGKFTDGAAGK